MKPLVIVLFVTVAATAHAQQGDLSQINGHPVPVGDHNQYHYNFKRTNLSTNPIGWIFGFYGVSGSYAFHDNFALRVDANLYRPVGTEDSGYEIGVGLPIYFRRAYSGAFLEPGVIYRTFSDGEATVGPQVLLGWQWIWDSGLNLAVAAGAGRNWSTSSDEGEVFANGYLRVGYAF